MNRSAWPGHRRQERVLLILRRPRPPDNRSPNFTDRSTVPVVWKAWFSVQLTSTVGLRAASIPRRCPEPARRLILIGHAAGELGGLTVGPGLLQTAAQLPRPLSHCTCDRTSCSPRTGRAGRVYRRGSGRRSPRTARRGSARTARRRATARTHRTPNPAVARCRGPCDLESVPKLAVDLLGSPGLPAAQSRQSPAATR